MIKDDRKISDDRTKEKCFMYFRGESTYEDEVSIRESLSDGRLSMDEINKEIVADDRMKDSLYQ